MEKYFDLISSQRYYHLIAFKFETKYSTQNYWKDCGISSKKNNFPLHDNSEFRIEQERIVTNIPYYNGERDYSVNGDGKEPYHYDLFVIELKKLNIFVFGFPFKFLAKTILKNLIDNKKLITKGSFVKPLLDKLIKLNSNTDFVDTSFAYHFSGLELMLTGDTNITSVNLDGDRPLDSPLYKNVFKKLIEGDECKLEKCSLKCETLKDDSRSIPKTRGNIHLDLAGNYKLYIHGSGNNIFTIPFIFSVLKKTKCLDNTLINPINNLTDE